MRDRSDRNNPLRVDLGDVQLVSHSFGNQLEEERHTKV